MATEAADTELVDTQAVDTQAVDTQVTDTHARDTAPTGRFTADVAIVGYGPVGVAAANFLGHYGISTVVFERDRDVYPRARAVTVNDWTLRAFQSVGLDAELKADMDPAGALHWKTYSGKEVFAVPQRETGLGQPPSMMIYQPAVEGTLRRGVERFTGVVDVRFGTSVTGIGQDDESVTLTVDDLDTGTTSTVTTQYVLACDGGSSIIRRRLGVKLLGETKETTWIVIDAEMLRWWPGCNDLTFWSDPDRPVVDIPLAKGIHRWEIPLGPDETTETFDSDEEIWALLRSMGRTPDEVRLRQHAFYVHHLREAETWRVGRTFLLGDAAHLMPPWAGQGMQSGIRDAQNLAWKLREVLAGRLPDDLLDTYQTEREPHVAAVTELSRRLGLLIASRDPKFIALRNNLGPIVKRLGPVVRVLLPAATTPAVTAGWLAGTPGKRSAVGRMIPQPQVCTVRGQRIPLDDGLGDGFVVLALGVDPRTLASPVEAARWEALGARFVTIRSANSAAQADTDLVDHTGELTTWLRRYRVKAVAVRPDRFVVSTDREGLALPLLGPTRAPTHTATTPHRALTPA